MPHDSDARGVYLGVCLEVIECSRKPPGPRTDGTPCSRRSTWVNRADAMLEAVRVIGLDVAVVNGGETKAGVDDGLDVPTVGANTAGSIGRSVVLYVKTLVVFHPRLRQTDARICDDGVIAKKVEGQKEGDRSGRPGRKKDENVHAESVGFRREMRADLTTNGETAECVAVRFKDFKTDGRGSRGMAVNMPLEESEDLCSSGRPVVLGSDLSIVERVQWIDQTVTGYLSFVVVELS